MATIFVNGQGIALQIECKDFLLIYAAFSRLLFLKNKTKTWKDVNDSEPANSIQLSCHIYVRKATEPATLEKVRT